MINSWDHFAYRVHADNHEKACDMFVNLFGYERVDEFQPDFPDGTSQSTRCTVLSPKGLLASGAPRIIEQNGVTYQTMPDLFISSSTDPNSIVAKYVANRKNIGGPHHAAYCVDSVEETMVEFKKYGFEFLTETPLRCEELTQSFTRPSDLVGIIFEFIERRQASFCRKSVGLLMNSTESCK